MEFYSLEGVRLYFENCSHPKVTRCYSLVIFLLTVDLPQPQVFPKSSRRQLIVGKTNAHRGRGRRTGPSFG